MLLIVASQVDSLARDFVSARSAALLTPGDLCAKGWRLEVGALERSFFVADGVIRSVGEIGGVVNLLPYVCEHELVAIEPADRAYVSAETSAFLFYFLSALPCPVANRPTPECLIGPGWRYEQWARACREVGIPTAPITRSSRFACAPGESGSLRSVTVLGGHCIEGQDLAYAANVVTMAHLAGVTFLQVTFAGEGARFHSVQLTPQLHNDCHRSAIDRFFER